MWAKLLANVKKTILMYNTQTGYRNKKYVIFLVKSYRLHCDVGWGLFKIKTNRKAH